MKFKEWYYMEMGGIRTMDTSSVDLESTVDPFNRYQAQAECKVKLKQQDFYKGIYGLPKDDPDSNLPMSPTTWKLNNPDASDEEEHSKWTEEYNKIYNAYYAALAVWERKRSDREEAVRPQTEEFIRNCIEEAKHKHETSVDPHAYAYNFYIDGKHYIASFTKVADNYTRLLIPNMFSVEFEGPDGYRLTNKEGAKATKIYGKLMLGTKKFLETAKVNALHFSPANKSMALIYRKFHTDYLSKDFVQVARNVYIKREYLKDRLKDLPLDQRQNVYKQIIGDNRVVRDELKKINQQKINTRNALMATKKFVGKLAGYKSSNGNIFPAYINTIIPAGNYSDLSADMYVHYKISGWPPEFKRETWPIKSYNPSELILLTDIKSVDPDAVKAFVDQLKIRVPDIGEKVAHEV